jgi:hypothetical protein
MPGEWTISAGDWPGRLGSLGVYVVSCTNPPDVPTVPFTAAGVNTLVQSANSTRPRSIHKPDLSGRIESMIYKSNGDIDVVLDLPADQPKRASFYFFDHYGSGQRQTAQVLAPGGAVLTEPIEFDSFGSGIYATIDVPGPCIVRWVRTGGYLVSISGIFIDPPQGPPPDVTAPVLLEFRIDATGKFLTILPNEPVAGETGFSIRGQANYPITLTFVTTEVDGALVYAISRERPIYRGETVLLSYTPGDVVDAAGNPLAAFADMVVNNLSESQGPLWQVTAREVLAQDNVGGVRTCQTIERFSWPE